MNTDNEAAISLAHLEALITDKDALLASLAVADTAPLLMVLIQLGGDPAWLDRMAPYITGPWSYHDETPPEVKLELQSAVVNALEACVRAGRLPEPLPPKELMPKMLDVCTGQKVPPEYMPVALEEMDLLDEDPRAVHWREQPSSETLEHFKVLVVGAGFSGVAMGIRLKQAGIPYTIIEKNDSVGGTWYENTYPGIGVDTANHFYSYSFDVNHDWDHFFAKGDEILRYIRRNAEREEITANTRFREEVTQAQWDESAGLWLVKTQLEDGSIVDYTANVLVSAVGQLNRASMPSIDGLENFKGPKFHTSNWDHAVSLEGKRVGMIGTGATGMQVGPAIAPLVGNLTIFQRSPHWAMWNPLYFKTVSENKKWVLKNIPYYSKWFRFQLFWSSSDGFHKMLQIDHEWPDKQRSLNAHNAEIRKQLEEYIAKEVNNDPELIRKSVPNYPPYGKRMLRDNHWYRMLTRENVDLVDTQIDHIEENAVVMADGTRHEVDVLVLATGFKASKMLAPMDIRGRGDATIRGRWGDDDPRAYLGITAPEFPNMFLLYGPNTNLGHGGSAVFHSECQVGYIMQGIRELIESGSSVMEVREAPFWEYQEKVDHKHRNMVWSHPGVGSWYKNKNGRVTANSPWRLVDYRDMTAKFEPSDYTFKKIDSTGSKEASV
jgi:4-hydroxyacetophenone monooxygenase